MPLLPADFDHTDAVILKKQPGLPAAAGEGREGADATRQGTGRGPALHAGGLRGGKPSTKL